MRFRSQLRYGRWLVSGSTRPLSEHWGRNQGTPVDRWYIERWLAAMAADIHGSVLEVRDSTYTARFGSAVTASHVLDIDPANPEATIVADLQRPDQLPERPSIASSSRRRCSTSTTCGPPSPRFIAQCVPAGVCLATVPLLSRLDGSIPPGNEYWRLTGAACGRLFGERFGGRERRGHGTGECSRGLRLPARSGSRGAVGAGARGDRPVLSRSHDRPGRAGKLGVRPTTNRVAERRNPHAELQFRETPRIASDRPLAGLPLVGREASRSRPRAAAGAVPAGSPTLSALRLPSWT